MLGAMEEVLFQYGVDAVFAGHVHAYERAHRTYKCALADMTSLADSAISAEFMLGLPADVAALLLQYCTAFCQAPAGAPANARA